MTSEKDQPRLINLQEKLDSDQLKDSVRARIEHVVEYQTRMRDSCSDTLKVDTVLSGSAARYCSHLAVVIDAHARTFVCSSCRANLDPYAWIAKNLADIANHVTQLRNMKAMLQAETKQLEEARAKLKASIRATVKRQAEKK